MEIEVAEFAGSSMRVARASAVAASPDFASAGSRFRISFRSRSTAAFTESLCGALFFTTAATFVWSG